MIITRTPYRVSFFGGGTDYPSWYNRFGGEVLTSTIDRYCFVCLRHMPPFLGSKYRVCWSQLESVDSREDIQHPSVRGCLQAMGIDDGVEVSHAGELPSRSGLGSSSAFTVGMLNALHRLMGKKTGKAELAKQAIHVEQEVLKETVGIQDQIQCAWGGINRIRIETDGKYSVQPILLDDQTRAFVESHFILFFTGLQRTASDIAAAQVDNVDRKQDQLKSIASLVSPAVEALQDGDMGAFGNLLHESWLLKRSLSDKITSSDLDRVYQSAMKAGAYGGKILGAGGGGFFLFCAPPDIHDKLKSYLGLLSIPLSFEFDGSQVVLS